MKMLKESNIIATKQDKAWKFVVKRFVPTEAVREKIPWINQAKLRGDTQVRT